jgi:hypothetical protein
VPATSSPGTWRLDHNVKLPAYRDAGVPEVWFANPQQRTIVVYGLSEDGRSCVEISRGGDGGAVESRVLPAGQRCCWAEVPATSPGAQRPLVGCAGGNTRPLERAFCRLESLSNL